MPILLTSALISGILSLGAALTAEHFLKAPIHIIGSFAMLRLSHNPGIAFSILLPSTLETLLIGTALIAVCIVAVRSRKERHAAVAFGLIIGGAIANLLDRIPDGFVTDYFSIGTFPVFNVADSFICIGAGLLIVESMWSSRGKK